MDLTHPDASSSAASDDLAQLPILVVDDDPSLAMLVQRMLELAGYTNVDATSDPTTVVGKVHERPPVLIVTDLHMPAIDGFELMKILGSTTTESPTFSFLVLTADPQEETKRRALLAGARDLLTKPFDQTELVLRVRNLLQVQHLQNRLRTNNASLEEQVAKRSEDLEQAQLETLDRLALAAEYRDDATQLHAWRIGRVSALLASAIGLPDEEVELLRWASLLHDIGKLAIPDEILLKPGRLTSSEFEQVKTHTTIGAEILSGSRSPLLQLAETIALTHHERWDGGGYPEGRSHDEIPLPGRIVAIADTFDALTHERPYKPAWPTEVALDHIRQESGRQFDPDAAETFTELDLTTVAAPVGTRAAGHHRRAHLRRSGTRPAQRERAGREPQCVDSTLLQTGELSPMESTADRNGDAGLHLVAHGQPT